MHWQRKMLPVAGSKTDVFIPGKIGFGAGEERRVGATASRVNREREKGEKRTGSGLSFRNRQEFSLSLAQVLF